MTKSESPSARTTVYRLRGLEDLNSAIRPKYLASGDFHETRTDIEGRKALLVTGAMRKERAAWAERLSSIAGTTVDEGNMTAAAVLIICDGDDTAFAMTYGMGFQLLDPASVDPGFGMRIAIRTASPEEIQSLTRTELDHRSRTDRSSIPAGDVLRGFGSVIAVSRHAPEWHCKAPWVSSRRHANKGQSSRCAEFAVREDATISDFRP